MTAASSTEVNARTVWSQVKRAARALAASPSRWRSGRFSSTQASWRVNSSWSPASSPVLACTTDSQRPPAARKPTAGVPWLAASSTASPQPSFSDGIASTHELASTWCLAGSSSQPSSSTASPSPSRAAASRSRGSQ